MEIKRLVLNSKDGDVDILYVEHEDVKRLASFERPSKEFRQSVTDLEKTLSEYVGKDMRLKSIAYKHEIPKHAIKVTGTIGAQNRSLVKIATDALEWIEDNGGKVLPLAGLAIEIVVCALALDERCVAYLGGERAQRELFPADDDGEDQPDLEESEEARQPAGVSQT